MAGNTRFAGKVALVTGGAAGLGRASALGFAREGARVAVVDVNVAGGIETVSLIESAGGEARFIPADVSRPEEVAAMVQSVVSTFGGLDVAHNNAGILGIPADAVNCTTAQWDRVIAVNLSSVWYCLKHEIPQLKARGKDRARAA